ncbi:MAG: fimbrillin family protein [Mucinivorans sp.]
MNKLLPIILCVGLIASCQKKVTTPENKTEQEIQLFASSMPVAIGSKASNIMPDAFGVGSAIGLYTQRKADSDLGSTTLMTNNKANSRYNFATPLWSVESRDDKLVYHITDPIYIFGYHPHSDIVGGSVKMSDAAAPHMLDFSLATDQSTSESLRLSDFMWCRASNNDLGYVRQSEPVSLLFGHQLCKVSISIRLYDSRPLGGVRESASVESIKFSGAEIYSTSTFNVLNGTLTPSNGHASVSWTPASTPLTIPVGSITDPATFVSDFILIPFVATASSNKIEYVLKFADSATPITFYSTIPVYNGTTLSPTPADGNKMRFGRNDYNKITVSIDVSSSFVSIDASIIPWGDGASTDLDGQRQ